MDKARETRRVFVLREVEIDFNDLQPGDVFRLDQGESDPTSVLVEAYLLAKSPGSNGRVVHTSVSFMEAVPCSFLNLRPNRKAEAVRKENTEEVTV
ncbi:MAG: FliM/FliN family flagellar motor C-terminal domain-containing protein [Dehalococcoidia bacterium]|nr:FliM/FliN family flagellar motor C-terminal domain-containing protein [Dehalococcoidia bacterium]